MSNKKPESEPEVSETQALTVFHQGTAVQKLPPALQQKLARFRMREAAGFAEQWKPTKQGDYLLGKILSIREVETQFGQTSVITLLCEDGKQRAIFPGTDLRTKLNGARQDQVYVIQFDGVETKKENPRLKNDMKKYSVIEVLPDGRQN
jgi:hypothetical protein